MGFQSSPQKNGLNNAEDVLDLLLRDGWSSTDPNDGVIAAAERLQALGLIKINQREFVICADPRDKDYPPPDRNCRGYVYLNEALDEGGDEIRCLECDRAVYPILDNKRRYLELKSRVIPSGAITFIREEVASLGDCRELAKGVFRCSYVNGEVVVCLVEICRETKYTSRDFAAMTPTVFITIDSRNRNQRLLDEPWLTGTSISALLSETDNLADLADKALSTGSPSIVSSASLQVYNRIIPPLTHAVVQPTENERRFIVEFGSTFIRIEGLTVVSAKAEAQLRVFGILWQQFIQDLLDGLPMEDFRPINLEKLADAFQGGEDKETVDAITVRRTLNRLQNDLTQTIRRELGIPIDRDDIIENRQGKHLSRKKSGYRINPMTILPRAARHP